MNLRSKPLLLLGVAVMGALALLAVTQSWVVVGLAPGAAAFTRLVLPGYELNPAFSPIAIAVLAAALALTIAGKVFRLVLGALLALLGAGIVVIAAAVLGDPAAASAGRVAAVTGLAGTGQHEAILEASSTIWPIVAVAAGVTIVLLGVLTLLRSGRWKVAGRKYSSGPGSKAADAPASGEPDRIADWDAMNQGQDPT